MVKIPMNNKFELHYYFGKEDKTHSMDAFIRNKCEHELLQIISEITRELDVNVKIETEAYEEGGLTELWTFLGTDNEQLNLILIILTLALSRIPLRKSKLEKEDLELSIQERKLNIEILKNELQKKGISENKINFEKLVLVLNSNYKIIKHKSNFYKHLYKYPKVKKLSTTKLNERKEKIDEPTFVERKDFEKFILESDNIASLSDENATIEIISPVLKKGKYKWKGIYGKLGHVIEFTMKDKEFKDKVVKEGIPFKNGTFIECILEIERKIDDLGNMFNSNFSVITVLKQHDEGISIETPQGKKYREKKTADKNQLELF
ncbi:MAG: hypothetical protein H6Q15_2472 [Bacteroidetes bacterium]|nr:hypothetical protein [Bacteroidota bacterium]